MKKYDMSVNAKQAEALEFLLHMVIEDDLNAFLEALDIPKEDFNELYGMAHLACVNFEVMKYVGK